MKYYLEVLHSLDDKDKNGLIITKEEFSTKAKAMTALEKKEINSNQKKRLHLCTHNESENKPCGVIEATP
tara:strand:+ start:494 stop:703 length:210 start_codon:yes stop_codon:yes gene_type:complete